MSVSKTLLTGEDLLRLSETGRYELVKGELITLPPASMAHGGIESTATIIVGNFVRTHRLGHVFAGELGVYLSQNPDTVRGADVAFYARGRLPQGARRAEYARIVPDLVIEVVATEDSAATIQERIEEWLRAGVRMLWVMFATTRSVAVYRSLRDVRVITGDDALEGDDVLPGFSVAVSEFFAES